MRESSSAETIGVIAGASEPTALLARLGPLAECLGLRVQCLEEGDAVASPLLVLVAMSPGDAELGPALDWRERAGVPVVVLLPEAAADLQTQVEQAGLAWLGSPPDAAGLRLAVQMARMQAVQLDARQAELALARDRLMQSDRLASIGQLAAGVAHEINNPVGYINSNLGTLAEYVEDLFRLLDAYAVLETPDGDGGAARRSIRELRESIQLDFLREDLGSLVAESREGVSRVRQIIEDLKDFSRAGEGEREALDLNRAMERTLNIVHNELKYKAEVVLELAELPPVECQASQIGQVMMNLLVNAAQAIEGQGRIVIRSGTQGAGQVWFEVADTGQGIEPEALRHIFDPFYTTKPVGEGTGLGLSISYGIVQRHGGRIEVDSRPGQGTRFRVVLPVTGGDQS